MCRQHLLIWYENALFFLFLLVDKHLNMVETSKKLDPNDPFDLNRFINAIKSRKEAIAYLNHPLLGSRLTECAYTILAIEGKTAAEIFGYPDDRKLKSSMTLFSKVSTDPMFALVLDKYFSGERDDRTIQLVKELK